MYLQKRKNTTKQKMKQKPAPEPGIEPIFTRGGLTA